MTALAEPRGLTERQSYALVAAAHLVLFAALSLAFRSVTPPPSPAEGVPVEIVADTPAPKAAPPTPEAAPPAPAPPQPAPPPETKPAPPPPPTPEPAPPKPAPPNPAPAPPVDDAAPPAKVKPARTKPAPLDTAALAKMLAKDVPKAKPLDTRALARSLDAAIPKTKPLDTAALAKSLDAALPRAPAHAARGDPKVSAAIAAAIRAQVTPCWTLPVGGGASGKVTALLHIAINRDGSITGRPGVVSQTGVTGANAAYARAFAEAASRAVLRCAPLKLPADQYDQWAQVEINFDPSNF